jgi:putative transcriptional regulator
VSYLLLDQENGDSPVIPRVTLGHSVEGLGESAHAGGDMADRIRMFAGYAGWSANQLEEEIERDAWVTHPASVELIFNTSPESLWQQVLRSKGWKYKILSQMPEDPSAN